jgi:L-histidine Nalpha-methyltransferase
MSTANVVIHQSQFPENVRRDLIESLRRRRVNHKFHYDSVKQTQKWLALHQAYSPSRNEDDCAAMYDRAFAEVGSQLEAKRVHVIGLGCGGGQKDTRLLKRLKRRGAEVCYTPSDVSVAMTLVARKASLEIVRDRSCFPLVCDLATAEDLPALFARQPVNGGRRLLTFFGMIPNFAPGKILPKLASLVRRQDFLLFSANLAPGANYAAGVRRILPQYDNAPTREWLLGFLLDLGVERRDGELRFRIESGPNGLKRVTARFHFHRRCRIAVESAHFEFGRGENIRLFFSYRYTPELVRQLLSRHHLAVSGEWITGSEEEGVFLVQRR